jgi:hypothetical protein
VLRTVCERIRGRIGEAETVNVRGSKVQGMKILEYPSILRK